ncbi:MAG: ABC transporter ATP-binding protein, partial [Lachnospiraceae bacterium]|nr:ABC transporter ATP-binding protein [Lachnospiraceae bacterium]
MARHGHGRVPGEKAKDFKGTMLKLLKYIGAYKYLIIVAFLFAIGATIFNIYGPKVLGKATTEIFTGLVGKISGGSGINFGKIGTILFHLLILYVIGLVFQVIQGIIMSQVAMNLTYRMRKEISIKINKLP